MVAAALKLWGLSLAPLAQAGPLASAPVQFAAVAWEFVLGTWLLSGIVRDSAWTLAVATFLVFAGVGLRQAFAGQASCGCFGPVKPSPWVALGIDATALAALAATRPARFGLKASALLVLGSSVLVGVLWLAVPVAPEPRSPVDDPAEDEAAGVYVEPGRLHFGRLLVGEAAEQPVSFRSRSDAPFSIEFLASDAGLVVKPAADGKGFAVKVVAQAAGDAEKALRFKVVEAEGTRIVTVPVRWHGAANPAPGKKGAGR
ncbi:MAG: hypothetical protein K2W96_21310 [Gemmataceae bacterium]|nr:hypothetical protein [Gemmataceae bacterium]